MRKQSRRKQRKHEGMIWTKEEVNFLRKYYKHYPTSWIARQLGRTVYAVRYKASDVSIKKRRQAFGEQTAKSRASSLTIRKQAAPSLPAFSYSFIRLSSKELLTTDTLDSAMAKPASSGRSVRPMPAKTPAAIGIPATL